MITADTKIGRLQRVQNQTVRILTRSLHREYITPLLNCLLVVERECVVSTRSSQDRYLLCKPQISSSCSNTFLGRSFLYAAPHEWNRLEKDFRVSECTAFKKTIRNLLSS